MSNKKIVVFLSLLVLLSMLLSACQPKATDAAHLLHLRQRAD